MTLHSSDDDATGEGDVGHYSVSLVDSSIDIRGADEGIPPAQKTEVPFRASPIQERANWRSRRGIFTSFGCFSSSSPCAPVPLFYKWNSSVGIFVIGERESPISTNSQVQLLTFQFNLLALQETVCICTAVGHGWETG